MLQISLQLFAFCNYFEKAFLRKQYDSDLKSKIQT